jgi:hypothetical protein
MSKEPGRRAIDGAAPRLLRGAIRRRQLPT